ncbi:MAG: DUF2461 domain-containing protein [Bacteroidales bacterium]
MQTCLDFLKDLSQNNNREWFDANRNQYEKAKKIFEGITDKLLTGIKVIDPTIGAVKAKDCTFRIFRDTRFSHDKTPYKTNMGSFMARGGRKSIYAGYYLHLEPGGKSFAGGGIYMPPADSLKLVRQEIFYNVDEFKKILNHKDFKKIYNGLDSMGDELKKAPQGYDPAWPDINLLKYKSYVVGKYMSDEELSSNNALEGILPAFKSLQPLVSFINRALEIPIP